MPRPVLLAGCLACLGPVAGAQLLVERLNGLPFDQFGATLAAVGDLDGDGIAEIAVGAPNFNLSSASGEGRVSVFRGADFTLHHEVVGDAHDALGISLAAAGDVDGDGTPDVVAGAPAHVSDEFLYEGAATAFSGRTGAVLWSIDGDADFEGLGTSVSGAGDLDGDGRAEVLVGTELDHLLVVDDDGSVLATIAGGLLYGYRVQGLADVSGDGVPELLVAESWFDPAPDQPRRGRVQVLSGAGGQLLYEVIGDADHDYLGRTLAQLGDVDGDGLADFIAASYVSSQGGNQAGLVRVLSGASGATLANLVGTAASQWLGFAVTGCGDLDLDGVPDYAVGIPGVPTTGSNGLGQVQLVSGADHLPLHDLFGQAAGSASNIALGMAVASADFNLDGFADVVAGDPVYEDPALGGPVGAAEVYLGCPAQAASYGAGWPGTNGVPELAATKPALGSTLTLDIGNSLGVVTAGLLLVGMEPSATPLSSGATLLVDPLAIVPITLGAGGTVLAGSIPDDASLCFAPLTLQVVELDPGAIGHKSLTAGLQLTVGFDL